MAERRLRAGASLDAVIEESSAGGSRTMTVRDRDVAKAIAGIDATISHLAILCTLPPDNRRSLMEEQLDIAAHYPSTAIA